MVSKFERDVAMEVEALLGATVKIRNQAAKVALAVLLDKTPIGDPSLWSPAAQEMNRKLRPDYEPTTLLANWNITLNEPDDLFDETKKVSGRREVQIEGNREIWDARRDDVIHFVNNTPYAARIEYDGYSVQAGKGEMVATAILAFEAAVSRMNAELQFYKAEKLIAKLKGVTSPEKPFLISTPRVE